MQAANAVGIQYAAALASAACDGAQPIATVGRVYAALFTAAMRRAWRGVDAYIVYAKCWPVGDVGAR